MAAATVASGPTLNVIGNKRRVAVKLTAPADTNTWASGLYNVDDVQVTICDATKAAAADAVSVTAVSGGTVTLGVTGTARDVYVIATGI